MVEDPGGEPRCPDRRGVRDGRGRCGRARPYRWMGRVRPCRRRRSGRWVGSAGARRRRAGCTPTSRRRRAWSSGRGRPPGPGSTSAAMGATSSRRPRCASSTVCRSATRPPKSANTSQPGSIRPDCGTSSIRAPAPACRPAVRLVRAQTWSGWRRGSPAGRGRAESVTVLGGVPSGRERRGGVSDAGDVLVTAAQSDFGEREITRTVNSAYRSVGAEPASARPPTLVARSADGSARG